MFNDLSDDITLCAYYNLSGDLLGEGTEDCWNEVGAPPASHAEVTINDDEVGLQDTDVSQLINNPGWTVMAVKAKEGRCPRKTLIDSGCNRTIFTHRHLFTDFKETRIPIKTAGEVIYATGVGTVGKLQNYFYDFC